jgi:protein tyrosine/serine phosphatase
MGWHPLDGALNFREVGGLPTTDGRRIRSGRLFRSDTLQFLTESSVRRLADEVGLATVVDLRLPYEVEVEGRGALAEVPHRYHHLPFLVVGTQQEGNATPRFTSDHDVVVQHYLGYLKSSPGSVAGVVQVLAEPGALPAVVHCAAGKDRTGVAIAVLLRAVGVRADLVAAEYAAGAHRMVDVFAQLRRMKSYGERLDAMPAEARVTEAATMERFLAAVEQEYGGVRRFLLDHGLDEATLEQLRAQLTEPVG